MNKFLILLYLHVQLLLYLLNCHYLEGLVGSVCKFLHLSQNVTTMLILTFVKKVKNLHTQHYYTPWPFTTLQSKGFPVVVTLCGNIRSQFFPLLFLVTYLS